MGTNAQSVAFLKREDYAKLELSSEMSLDNVLDAALNNSESSEAGGASGSQTTQASNDLSAQIQVINLGYLGQDSNIFELASTYVDFSFMPLFTDFKSKT